MNFQKVFEVFPLSPSNDPGDLEGITVCVDAANGATATSVNRLFADLETDFLYHGNFAKWFEH